MSESGETSGTSMFMFGMIVVILIAVFGATWVNKHFHESKSYREIERSVTLGINEIEELESHCASLRQRVSLLENNHLQSSQQINQLQPQLAKLDHRKIMLSNQRTQLTSQFELLQNEFAVYREQTRISIWIHAEGESLGDLRTLDGRVLQQATISKVTPLGLEIRHQDGFAKLSVSSLHPSLRERFCWE